ncbi:MAG: DUF2927 domain-containing protein [Pseudomonadota bacterium]
MIRVGRHILAMAAALAVAACDLIMPVEPVLTPRARPERPAPAPQIQPTSEQSARLRAYLASVQSTQLTQGLLRQDGGGVDTPFTADMLARNFRSIAFFSEYGGSVGVSGRLRRYEQPVRMKVIHGAALPPSERAQATRDVTDYAARLSRITGHPISVGGKPNFLVYFVSEDERRQTILDTAPQILGLEPRNLNPILNISEDIYCAVISYRSQDNRLAYGASVAVIRTENPDLLRLSCIHEELAQGLGLANDSPEARPSIFNDDDEFALLTRHDELLLQLLYDDRLKTGMTLPEAEPVVRILAREAMGQQL